jgi:type I restriction enzyme S subunit
MRLVKLGDITENLDKKRIPLNASQREAKSKKKLYPYVGANNILCYIDDYIFDEEILCVAEDGGSWGSKQVCAIIYNEKCWVNNHAHVLRAKEGTNLTYIKNYLNYADLNSYITGATRGKLTRKHLDLIKIPLPSIDDQTRIATLLSKVESLIAKRKKSVADLDELLKSTFLEMFGDPVRNEMGWAKEKFDDLLENIDSGWSPKCEPVPSSQDEWGVLKLGAVTTCIYNETENKALIPGTQPKKNLEICAGDLLFSRKNTYDLVAACAYVFKTRPRLLLPDLIFRFVLKKKAKVNPIFLWKLLTSYSQRKAIQSLAGGAAGSMPNISKAKLKTIKLPMPPERLQNQFAIIVEKVESLKEKYQNSLKGLETLYGALSQKAFKGKLDLSRIPITVELKPKDITTGVPQVGEPVVTFQDKPDKAPEAREQILHRLFNGFISGAKNGALFLDDFWLEAEEKLMDFMDEDAPPLSVADYDRVRDWLFDMLAQGKVAQVFNEQENRMEIRSVS